MDGRKRSRSAGDADELNQYRCKQCMLCPKNIIKCHKSVQTEVTSLDDDTRMTAIESGISGQTIFIIGSEVGSSFDYEVKEGNLNESEESAIDIPADQSLVSENQTVYVGSGENDSVLQETKDDNENRCHNNDADHKDDEEGDNSQIYNDVQTTDNNHEIYNNVQTTGNDLNGNECEDHNTGDGDGDDDDDVIIVKYETAEEVSRRVPLESESEIDHEPVVSRISLDCEDSRINSTQIKTTLQLPATESSNSFETTPAITQNEFELAEASNNNVLPIVVTTPASSSFDEEPIEHGICADSGIQTQMNIPHTSGSFLRRGILRKPSKDSIVIEPEKRVTFSTFPAWNLENRNQLTRSKLGKN